MIDLPQAISRTRRRFECLPRANIERLQLHLYWRLLLVIGFLGGYTTFSSFEYESLRAVRAVLAARR